MIIIAMMGLDSWEIKATPFVSLASCSCLGMDHGMEGYHTSILAQARCSERNYLMVGTCIEVKLRIC